MSETFIEEWRKIPGFSLYEITSNGIIRSWNNGPLKPIKKHPKVLKGYLAKAGYVYFSLYSETKRVNVRRSVCVALAWLGPRPKGYFVCHKNGKNSDDRVDNLIYKTPKGNSADRYEHGTILYGERNVNAILTPDLVIEIFTSQERPCDLSRKLQIKPSTISSIKRGENWKHLTKNLIVE